MSRPCCIPPPTCSRIAAPGRWCWSGPRASTSTTAAASATSRVSPGCGARGSATATRSWSRPRASRCRGSPSRTCSAGAATSRPSRWPRRSRPSRPCPTSKVFFTNSGSEANDTQVKLAWYYNNVRGQPKRKKIIARQRGYHGTTIASGQPVGPRRVPRRFRPADRAACCTPTARITGNTREAGESEEDYASRARPQPRRPDRARGAGHDRRLHRRAGDGRGRRARSARHLFREGAGRAGQARHRLHRRRGDLRLCPHRQLVGLADLRHAAVDRHDGQGRSPRPTCRWAR